MSKKEISPDAQNYGLFKYIPLRETFFENFHLRATRRQDLNDPFELLPTDLAWAKYYAHTGNTKCYSEKEMADIISKTEFLSLSEQAVPIFNSTGIVSLTEKRSDILMWSHYAEGHTGMVLEFDSQHRFFNQPQPYDSYTGRLHKVVYSPERPSDLLDDPKSVFTTKAREWKYEREWRLILSVADADKCYKHKVCESTLFEMCDLDFLWEEDLLFMFSVPKEAIRSVTFGAKTKNERKLKVKEKIKKDPELDHVGCYKSVLSRDGYSLEIIED